MYKIRSYNLSMAIGREAAVRKIKCFVEVSTGMVYKPDSAPRKESAKLKPWLKLAKWKLQAEEDLAKVSGLNLVVLRLAHVYGPYASKFLGTALSLARVYQSLGKELKWLWDRDLRTNTVHVDDVSRALWSAAKYYVDKSPWRERPVWNVVDKGNTSESTPISSLDDMRRDVLTPSRSRNSGGSLPRGLRHPDRFPRHRHIHIREDESRLGGRRRQ